MPQKTESNLAPFQGEIHTPTFCADKWLSLAMSHAVADATDLFQRTVGRCESPIEQKLLAEFVGLQYMLGSHPDSFHVEVSDHEFIQCEDRNPYDGIFIFLQADIERFRVDFLLDGLWLKQRMLLAVECDGHDFHDRTKIQAARDRSRDRKILYDGVLVIRFTGSEIWHSGGLDCASEAYDILASLLGAPH